MNSIFLRIKSFKKNFISKAYDQYSEYKIVDFLRNYMQHGHIPIHYDEEKIYLDLSEIWRPHI